MGEKNEGMWKNKNGGIKREGDKDGSKQDSRKRERAKRIRETKDTYWERERKRERRKERVGKTREG